VSRRIAFTVLGRPYGKGRPRGTKAGHFFTPRATTLAENEVRAAWERAGAVRLEGPLQLRINLFIERPKGHFKTSGDLNATGLRNPLPAGQKPDVDNALKLVMDALNTRAWKDDVQVVQVAIRRRWVVHDPPAPVKSYDLHERTEIEVSEVEV
jgi:Holliday junction resolvase RusA-like endonuclease